MALLLAFAGSLVVWTADSHKDSTVAAGPTRSAVSRLIPGNRYLGQEVPHVQAALYGGFSSTRASDVYLRQPRGTDMHIRDVHWRSEPEKMPPYHGFRGTWWLPLSRSFGVMGDLVYVKVIADRTREVEQSGTRDGRGVPKSEPLLATFERLEFTDGLNLLTGSLVYRLPIFGRVRPYVGIGVGASLPHAEVRRTGSEQRTFSFQLAGYVIQAFGGFEVRLSPRASVFAEYRSSYATNTVSLVEGGTLQADLLLDYLSVGLSGLPRRRSQPATPR